MKIFYYDNKLVEEVGSAENKVIFLNVLKEEDRNKCPHCGKPIPTELSIVENSPNFKENTRPVETL